ncbi:probable ATP-dependent RNA helicase DDX58 [Rhinichthys klamathensis goyatoka]|uniref:probable ATP-dependent RNA helicase DDX58 n=1 Tax=Rhinichthys klamathensis goyatoka TaxID=3034132 RepID=UPI0024B48C3F|nr:probable ATP-dependent RNA helicase DDX58 [Rhinichthys klamathensis goyatoka]
MYELEKENLRRLSDYIAKILRPSLIKTFMTTHFDKEMVERILSAEETSVTTAAQMLLDQMCYLEEEGWFQAFLDTLFASEYTGLYKAIKEWDFGQLEELNEYRKLLERIEPSITKLIKPSELLTHMNDCLKPRECEEIKAVEIQKGRIAASERLVDTLLRSDKPNWFKVLKMALDACSCDQALELLESNGGGTASMGCVSDEEADSMTTETVTTVSFEFREEAESEDMLMNANNMTVTETPSGFKGEYVRSGERKLREYQKELTDAAEGQNTIICAPTGCGKTIVAVAICEHHLKKCPGQAKIVFLATKVDVYEQQYKLFKEHFSITDPNIRVTGMCGDMELSVRLLIESHDIVVMTAQILVNALQSGEVPSLDLLSLILLDECHNTTGKHPYNNIMTRYLDTKLSSSTHSLPQIVGLTASVGIGSFKDRTEAENNILQLCANLDTRVIATVTKHLDELRTYVHTPDKDFFEVPQRMCDPFIRIIRNIMSNIEQLAQNTYNIESLSNIQNREYGSQKYEQWIVSVQKSCRVIAMKNSDEERRICRDLCNYTEHLRKYNDALIINEDARTKDSLDFLDGFFEQVRNAGFDETERKLTALYDSQRPQLLVLATEGQQNPKLEELRFILEEEYHNNDQTRTVLFVRTRALADAMKKWIDDTDSLKFLMPGVLIGKGRKSNFPGSVMTPTNKKGVLDSFKSSDQSKILIATSVADEGIDIPQCNLVLMYEYVGNVVKMVQVRGRGRAQGSRCFLISSNKDRIMKEKINMFKEKIVEEAIVELQSLHDLSYKVDRLQREDKARRDHVSASPEKPKNQGSYRLLCGKCKKFACLSDDLRVVQESHHIALDRSMFERFTTFPHKKPKTFCGFSKNKKMLCGDCKHDWGLIASYLTIQDLPLLKIESFVVQDRVTQEQFYFRKWREVTFAIREFDMKEITPQTWPLRD